MDWKPLDRGIWIILKMRVIGFMLRNFKEIMKFWWSRIEGYQDCWQRRWCFPWIHDHIYASYQYYFIHKLLLQQESIHQSYSSLTRRTFYLYDWRYPQYRNYDSSIWKIRNFFSTKLFWVYGIEMLHEGDDIFYWIFEWHHWPCSYRLPSNVLIPF